MTVPAATTCGRKDGLSSSLETDCPSNIRSFGDVVAWRKIDIVRVFLRLICIASSAMALSFMVMAHEASTLVLYGFQILVQSDGPTPAPYSISLVRCRGCGSLLKVFVSVSGMLRKSSIAPSRNFGWFLFAADQAYTLISAGLTASNLNRTGIKYTPLPNFASLSSASAITSSS